MPAAAVPARREPPASSRRSTWRRRSRSTSLSSHAYVGRQDDAIVHDHRAALRPAWRPAHGVPRGALLPALAQPCSGQTASVSWPASIRSLNVSFADGRVTALPFERSGEMWTPLFPRVPVRHPPLLWDDGFDGDRETAEQEQRYCLDLEQGLERALPILWQARGRSVQGVALASC